MVSRTRRRTCHDSAAAIAGKSERGRNSADEIGQVIGGLRTLGPDDGDLRPFGNRNQSHRTPAGVVLQGYHAYLCDSSCGNQLDGRMPFLVACRLTSRADDVVWILRSFCYVYVCVCVCWHDETKTHDRNDLNLGTVIVLDTMSKPFDLGFTRSNWRDTGSFSNIWHQVPSSE